MYKFAAEIQIRSQGSRLLTLSAPHINHNPAKMIKKILPDMLSLIGMTIVAAAGMIATVYTKKAEKAASSSEQKTR